MVADFVSNVVKNIDPVNAEFIMNNYEVKNHIKMMEDWLDDEKSERIVRMAFYHLEDIKKFAREYKSRYINPSNIKVGDGVTIILWSDKHACTVTKVTKTTVTVRRDKATLNPDFKPEWISGGFAGHCTNQDEQTYSYEPDEKGKQTTFHWSKKYQSYGLPNNLRLIKGRHEFYDYNF